MLVNIVNITKHGVLVEFRDSEATPQRLVISQELLPVSIKGATNVDESILSMGVDYSNVDLVATLGEELPSISVYELERALREQGLWTREDYRTNPNLVSAVVGKLRNLDTARIINAAMGIMME